MKKRITGIPGSGAVCLLLFFLSFCITGVHAADGSSVFSTLEEKERFAAEISTLVADAWEKWQDKVTINDIDVEASRGMLRPGDMGKTFLTADVITASFKRDNRSQEYIGCVKAAAGALGEGMRAWQRGYFHKNIPFPQGASCTYTLPPCHNIPVTVGSGGSPGDKLMDADALYNYMLYQAPENSEDVKIVFRGTARAISGCFERWKNSCSIMGILATGGIAPSPSPMDTGPGPVRGAKGQNGKLAGQYFDGSAMYEEMVRYFEGER